MTRIYGYTVHHASFLTLKKDGTMILPIGQQKIVFDLGALRFNLVQRTVWENKILSSWKVLDISKAGWY